MSGSYWNRNQEGQWGKNVQARRVGVDSAWKWRSRSRPLTPVTLLSSRGRPARSGDGVETGMASDEEQ
jgi:hypothetical protein